MRVLRRLLAAQATFALYALVALALKAKPTTSTGGNATANGTWADALKPKTSEESDCKVISPATLTWNSLEVIESLTADTGSTFAGTGELQIGTGNEPPSAVAMSLAAGATVPFSGEVRFQSKWTGTVTISLGGHALVSAVKFVNVAGVGGKYKLLADAKLSTSSKMLCFVEEKVSLDTGGHNVESWWFHAAAGSTLKGLTGTTFTILSTGSAEGFDFSSTATGEGEPSVVFTGTASPEGERQCNLGGHAFVAVTWVAFTLVEGSSTTGTFNLNNKAAPGECKGTLTALSNHLVVTSGEAALFARTEVTGAGIPVGTTIVKKVEAGVWEMSANATETVLVAEAVKVYNPGVRLPASTTQTITTLTCNGTQAEPCRIASTVAGTPATISGPEGETTGVARVKDIKFANPRYMPNATDLGGNTNLIIGSKPAVLAVHGGGGISLVASHISAAATAVHGGGSVVVAGSRVSASTLAVRGGGRTSLTGSAVAGSGVQVRGGGRIGVAGSRVIGGGVAVRGGGRVATAAYALVSGAVAVRGGGRTTLAGGVVVSGTLAVRGGGSVRLASFQQPVASPVVHGGGRVVVAGHPVGFQLVKVTGGGSTKVSGFQQPTSVVSVRGGGRATIIGRLAQLPIQVRGGGLVRLVAFQQPQANLIVHGGGRVVFFVPPVEMVHARIEIVNGRGATIEIVNEREARIEIVNLRGGGIALG